MQLTAAAERYCSRKGVSRVLVYNVSRFARFFGNIPLEQICTEQLEQFILLARKQKLSPSTIRGTVCAIRTLVRDAGRHVTIPHVQVPPPEPHCFPTSSIDSIWPHLSAWGRQHVALTYHCCFRLDDILRLQLHGVPADVDVIQLRASKTQRNHSVPVVTWVRQWLGAVKIPFAGVNDWSQVIVRAELDRCCTLAGISRILPSDIRRAGITAWGQANGMAGEIIHGCGLSGVMRHYVDKIQILESAAPRVRVPQAMRGDCNEDTVEATLLTHFRRMDQAAQSIITSTAERLSAG